MKHSIFYRGGGLSRDSVWRTLLAKLEAGGQSLRLLVLSFLLVLGMLMAPTGAVWAAAFTVTGPKTVPTTPDGTTNFTVTWDAVLNGDAVVNCTGTDFDNAILALAVTDPALTIQASATSPAAVAVTYTGAEPGDQIECTITPTVPDTAAVATDTVTVPAMISLTAPVIAPSAGATTVSFPYTITGTTNGDHIATCTMTLAAGGTGTTTVTLPAAATIAAASASAQVTVALSPAASNGDVVECKVGPGGTDTVDPNTASVTIGLVPPEPGRPVIQLSVPDNSVPPVAIELFPQGTLYPNPTACVDFGYITISGTSVKKTFTVGSAFPTPGLGVTSVNFSPLPDDAFKFTNPINLSHPTIVASALPAVIPPATPKNGVGYFDVTFDSSKLIPAPSTSQATVVNRQMLIYNTDPATIPTVNPLIVPISATVVPTVLPKIQVADSTTAVPPAGTDISNGTPTPIEFTPSAVSSGTSVTRTFSIRNGGYATLALAPSKAIFTPDEGTNAGTFTVNSFTDEGSPVSAFNDTSATSISPPAPQGCNTVVSTTDYSGMRVTFTAPTVTKQTTFGGKVCFMSNDNLATTTASVEFCFPVKATVYPPPPTNAEIDVYEGTKLIPSLDLTGVDFGTIAADGKDVKQKTLRIHNPSGVILNISAFSANLPEGFKIVNSNYANEIIPGSSTNVIFQCGPVTTAGDLGASNPTCTDPLTAGCALRIESNDRDNSTWEFNGGGVENPYTIPFRCVATGGTVTNVSLTLTQPANGVVTSDSGGINCGTGSTTCTADYTPGTTVALTATADTGATFSGWGGDCTGTTSPLTVTMSAAKNCSATFTSGGGVDPGNQVALTITTPTNGIVTGDKGGINCGTGGNTCTANYDPSTVVVLTAAPDNGATFKQWGGSCSGTTSPLSITMDTAKNCTATFETTVVTTDVTLTITKPTVGNIMSSAGGINCGTAGTTCTATYSKDTTIQLMGAADNMTLDTWTGDCSGSNNPLSVAMNQDKTCSATFKAGIGGTTQPTLTITQPTGGSVTGNPGGISCGASGSTCVASYTAGDVISLTAIPALGNTFTGWGGSCVGTTNPLSVTMDAAKTCTAAFTTAGGNDPPPVTNQLLTINTPTGGKVTSDVGGISCGTNSLNCTANYTTGSIVRLTAMADAGATFAGWGGNCTGTTSPTVLTMDAAKTCSATFTNTGGNTCSSTNLPACTTEATCTSAGGTFTNGACTSNTTGTCSATSLSTCTTEASCGGAGGIFVSNACTVAPILSHPQKGVAALINKATEQTFNVPAFFAAGASVNGAPFAPMVSVKASDVVDWAVNITVNPIHLGQSANVLFVIGVEPPSPTDPITGYSGNEDTQYFALDEGLNLFPVNLYAGPAEWGAEVDKMIAKPFKRVTLQSRMSLSLRKGTLAALVNGQSRARVYTFVGYALADGTIVYNGMPIITTLE